MKNVTSLYCLVTLLTFAAIQAAMISHNVLKQLKPTESPSDEVVGPETSTEKSPAESKESAAKPVGRSNPLINNTVSPIISKLQNQGGLGLEYTAVLGIGGEEIRTIVDTGSFELVVFSVDCEKCGEKSQLYSPTKSKHFHGGTINTTTSYGSGDTLNTEAFDVVTVGRTYGRAYTRGTIAFWDVYDAEMELLSQPHDFASILGVGPPSSAIKFAAKNVEYVDTQVEAYKKEHGHLTKEIQDTVAYYHDVLAHARNATSLVYSIGLEYMSHCLGQDAGSDGYWIFNDTVPIEQESKFLELNNTGDLYWSLDLSDVSLSRITKFPPKADATFKKNKSAPLSLSCSSDEANTTCSVIVDSGTSLNMVPSDVLWVVYARFTEWEDAGGTCDDVSSLPNLTFSLNGKSFSMPPESYVGSFDDEEAWDGPEYGDLKTFMPHLKQTRERKSNCEVMLMSDNSGENMYILGMPFFRYYYTSFRFQVDETRKTSIAKSMLFSFPDEKCKPAKFPSKCDVGMCDDDTGKTKSSDEDQFTMGDASSEEEGMRKATMKINPLKIRFPHKVRTQKQRMTALQDKLSKIM